MTVPFWKMESVGNHFPLVREADAPDPAALAIAMCEHRFGVGGDGLLVVSEEPGTLRMFNPDGTEDFCGNGLRCAARWWADRGASGSFDLAHLGRMVAVSVEGEEIRTVLGRAIYDPTVVPHLESDELFAAPFRRYPSASALSTGSTHLVVHVAEPPADFEEASRELEHDRAFPERTSIMWTTDEGPDLRLRIWERWVGETFGCGSGATAAAADRMRRDGRGGEVVVRMRGGEVRVSADRPDGPLTVIGTARCVFRGEIRV